MNDFNQLAAFQIQMFPYEQLRPDMAGGMIRKEKECLLGRYPKDTIRDSFLRVLS